MAHGKYHLRHAVVAVQTLLILADSGQHIRSILTVLSPSMNSSPIHLTLQDNCTIVHILAVLPIQLANNGQVLTLCKLSTYLLMTSKDRL